MSDSQPEQLASPPAQPSRKRRWATGCLALFLAALLGAGYMLWTVKKVPQFYREAAAQVADPAAAAVAAAEFKDKVEALKVEATESPAWTQTFPQSEINSWLSHETRERPEILPEGVRDPLVSIGDGSFQLGVEVNWEDWSGIISLEASVEVYEPRTLRFHLLHMRLGELDVSMEEVRQRVKPQIEALESDVYQVAWLDTPDGPIIEVAFTDPDTAHVGLEEVRLDGGELTLRGVNQAIVDEAAGANQRP